MMEESNSTLKINSIDELLGVKGKIIYDGNSTLAVNTSPYTSAVNKIESTIATSRWEDFTKYRFWEESRLEEVANDELLKITSQQKLSNGYPHLGWIFLREARELYYEMEPENSRVTILEGQAPLEEDINIRIAIVEKPREISLFICPESIGTVWEMEEFRELFIDFFNKYIEEWKQPSLTEDIHRIEPTPYNPWNDPYRDVILKGGPNSIGMDNWMIGDSINYGCNSSCLLDTCLELADEVQTKDITINAKSLKDYITSKINNTLDASNSL